MNIGGLDVGTTGCKLTVFDSEGRCVQTAYREYDVSRASGEHEIDANVIFASVKAVIADCAECNLAAIGVTTFGESFVALDRDDNVLLPTMLYTDPRGGEECRQLCDNMGEDRIIHIAGVKPHQMYSLPKIMWIKNNLPKVYEQISKILLMEDYIVYMLCGNRCIDYSLAARTMAFDIRNKCWSGEIFDSAGVDTGLMSECVPAGNIAGTIKPHIANELGIADDVRIINGSHDQVASAVGSGALDVGMAVDGTGTVECVTPVFGDIPDNDRLYEEGYSVVPYVFDGTYVCYALSFTGGAVLKWYRDNFATREMALAKEQGKNVYDIITEKAPCEPTDILVLPHFAGAANPYMDNGSKAVFAGLTLEHTKYDIYRALMEGVTYEMMVNLQHLESFGIVTDTLYATGGGAKSAMWLQIKADVTGRTVVPVDADEVGAMGTYMLAAVAMGIYKDLHHAKDACVRYGKAYTPGSTESEIYSRKMSVYSRLYETVRPLI